MAEKDCAVLGAHARAAQCLAYQTRDEAQAERQALCIALAQSRVCKRELEQRVAELRAELSKEKEGSAHGEVSCRIRLYAMFSVSRLLAAHPFKLT